MSERVLSAAASGERRLTARDSFWAMAVAAAAAAAVGGAAVWFHQVEYWAGYIREWGDEHPWAYFLWVPALLTAIFFLRDFVFPGTEGTGIPQTIASLKLPEGPDRDRVLSLRIACGKLLLTALGLVSGASIGREGPTVHVGACFMKCVSRWARFPRIHLERGLILSGGAAGIAASFNAPLAGIVFAVEEIGRSFEKENAALIVRTVAVACLVAIWALGGDFRYFGEILTHLDGVEGWVAVLVAGLVGGLLGGFFSRALVFCVPWFSVVCRQSVRHRAVAAVSVGVALAALGIVSGGATLFSGYGEAHRILHAAEPLSPWYGLGRMVSTFLTLMTGIPGGLFDPSLSAGAGLGQVAAGWFPGVEPRAVVLLFMVSYFSGVVQSPITSAVIMTEMTGCLPMTLPMLFAAIIAYQVSHRICPVSLYESLAIGFLRRHVA